MNTRSIAYKRRERNAWLLIATLTLPVMAVACVIGLALSAVFA